MRAILLLVCVIVFSVSGLTVRVWDNGASDGDMNNGTNYNPDGALGASDSLLFDGSGGVVANATASAAISVGAIKSVSGYTGTITSEHPITVAQRLVFDHNGGLVLDDSIYVNGARGEYHVGSGVTSATIGGCDVVMNTLNAGVLDLDKSGTLKSLRIPDGDTVSNTSGIQLTILNITAGRRALYIGDNAKFTTNPIGMAPAGNTTLFYQGSNSAWLGSGYIDINPTAAVTCTIPAVKYTGSGVWYFDPLGSVTRTIVHTGNFDLGTARFDCYGGAGTFLWKMNGNNLKCGIFAIGASGTGAACSLQLGSGRHSINTWAGTSYNAASPNVNIDLGACVCTLSSSITYGSNHKIIPGTSTVIITGASTVTTANKFAFYDLDINSGANTVTFADSLKLATGGDYTVTSGSVTHNAPMVGEYDIAVAGSGTNILRQVNITGDLSSAKSSGLCSLAVVASDTLRCASLSATGGILSAMIPIKATGNIDMGASATTRFGTGNVMILAGTGRHYIYTNGTSRTWPSIKKNSVADTISWR